MPNVTCNAGQGVIILILVAEALAMKKIDAATMAVEDTFAAIQEQTAQQLRQAFSYISNGSTTATLTKAVNATFILIRKLQLLHQELESAITASFLASLSILVVAPSYCHHDQNPSSSPDFEQDSRSFYLQ
jgi:hypothetical protein